MSIQFNLQFTTACKLIPSLIYFLVLQFISQQEQLRRQLQIINNYTKTLQKDFQNNLQVIQQRQQQIEELTQQIDKLQYDYKVINENMGELQAQTGNEINHLHQDYSLKIKEKQQQMQQMILLLQNRLRKQIQTVSNRLNNQIKRHKQEISDKEEAFKRASSQNSKLNQVIQDQKMQILSFQSRMELIIQEKNSYANKMTLHLKELESVKASQQNWQDNLKQKIKQTQTDKQKVEEQLSQVKLAYKQKLKRQKDQFGKKILQIAQQKQKQVRQMMLQQKEMKYKFQKAINDSKQLKKQCQNLKQEKGKLQSLLNKYKQSDLKSNFQKNHKQFEMMQKMFDQNARDLKNQIESLTQQKKSMKQELDQANIKRESVEKAVERLKVQLINKSKEADQSKKQIKRIKNEMEMRLKELQINNTNNNNNKEYQINTSNKAYDMIQSAKVQNDYSKVFTQDMGVIDDRFFEASSPLRSPKHNKNVNFQQYQNNSINREAQMLKKIGELQLQNQQYKNLIKKLKEEAENMKKICQQDKNRQISLYRDKANIYWQKANDKQQQIAALRQQYNQLKANYSQLNSQFKNMKQNQNQVKQKQISYLRTKEKLSVVQKQNADLQDEIKCLEGERKMLQDISAELRSEIYTLKQMLNSNISYQQPISQQDSNYHPPGFMQYGIHGHDPQRQPMRQAQMMRYTQVMRQTEPIPPKHKIPKKLHDLVREKKTLSISGKRAPLEERTTEIRLDHIGTESQKEILQKIKVKNKTPPKVTNYAQLKQKEREKRTSLIETASQKEVLERLKNRNTNVISPQRGVNYLELRQNNENE